MEPPSKRARYGRAPHDDFSDFSMPMDYNSKRTGLGGGEGGKKKNGGDSGGQDEEDEIAMDPEDYAMKLNPQYRLEKSRAVADNKLKSALELLFEKYSKDFGDTGDEINFYTDEIEVDNGHISSIIAQGGDKEDEDEDGNGHDPQSAAHRKAQKAEELARGLSLLSSGPAYGGREPESMREAMGMGMGVGMGMGMTEPRPAVPTEELVDPTWAAPDISEMAFNTPRPPGYAMQPPRISYSVPHRSIFRKSLPESFGTPRGAGTGDKTKENDRVDQNTDVNDDDLLIDSSEPILKLSHGDNTPRRRVSNWRGPSPNKATAESPPLSQPSSVLPDAAQPSSLPPPPSSVLSSIAQPDGLTPVPTATESRSASANEEANTSSNQTTEIFSRNALDPSYAFSDDEDFGLKRRNTASKPATSQLDTRPPAKPQPNSNLTVIITLHSPCSAVTTPTTPSTHALPELSTTEKKRGPGRPRLRPIKPVGEKRPVGRPRRAREPGEESPANSSPKTQTGGSAKATNSPHPLLATSAPFEPSLCAAQPSPQPLTELAQKRRVGRPKKIREADITNDTASSSATGEQSFNAQELEPPSSPPPTSATSTPSKPPAQAQPLSRSEPPAQQKRRVGRPKKIRDAADPEAGEQPGSSPGVKASQGAQPASAATPALSMSRSPSQVLSPPLWQSVSQLQQKRRVGRPRKVSRQEEQAVPESSMTSLQLPSQELPQKLLPQSLSQPSSQSLPQPRRRSSPFVSGEAEIPDSQGTSVSSRTSRRTGASKPFHFTLRSSLRSEIPDSEGNLSSSIITLVSDDDEEAEEHEASSGNQGEYDDMQTAISAQVVGLGGSRLSPTRRSPTRLSPSRNGAVTPSTTSRFVVIPRSGSGSGRASPLARSVLRTPSPVKFMPSRLSSASKRLDGANGGADVPSPSGSVVQTPGGTMRRCGQDGFRCEREFCFKCA